MTFVFYSLPALQVRDTKPEKRRAGKQANRPHKYDHWQMLRDRLAGMTWYEIGVKHGVPGKSKARISEKAYRLCMNSEASKHVAPHEVERLTELGKLRRRRNNPAPQSG